MTSTWVLGWLFALAIGVIAAVREQGHRRRIDILEAYSEYADVWLVIQDMRQRIAELERTRRPLTHVMEESMESMN